MMHRAHQSHETRAILRAVDAPNDPAMTWGMLGAVDTISRHPVHTMDGPSTRLGLSKMVDQQTGSRQVRAWDGDGVE